MMTMHCHFVTFICKKKITHFLLSDFWIFLHESVSSGETYRELKNELDPDTYAVFTRDTFT